MSNIPDFALRAREEYIQKGYWQSLTQSDLWEKNAHERPHEEGLIDQNTRLTWGEANQWIDRLALGLLELRFRKGEVLVIQLPNSVELCLLRVACEKAGIFSLLVIRTMRQREMEYILCHTQAAGVVIPWQYRDFDYFVMIQELRPKLTGLRHILVAGDKAPDGAIALHEIVHQPKENNYAPDYLKGKGFQSTEPSLLFLTTGSTGFPKFVVYSTAARLSSGRDLVRILKLSNKDIMAALAPAAGGPNIPVYYGAPFVGAKIVLMEHYEPEQALQLIEKEKVTIPCVVPAQLAMLLQSPNLHRYNYNSIRTWLCTGSPLSYNVGRQVEEKIGGIVINSYGAADFGGWVIPNYDDPQALRLLSVGKPMEGTEIKLTDEIGREVEKGEVGEICGKGPACSWGYFHDTEATRQAWTQDGWFHTGDLGKWDENGNLMIVGRKKDMIIRGGQNIYPVEIENLLLSHPKVQEVAIVGMPDTLMGEKTCAYVVPKKGTQISFEDMISFLKEKRIAAYKLPERLEIIDKLPMLSDGQKIDKKALRQDIVRKSTGPAPSSEDHR